MFNVFDDRWSRKNYFRHYMDNLRCTYSLTVQIDITLLRHALKANGLKAYPAQIYMLASVVNRLPEFRMGLSETGEPGCWEMLHPAYTVFNTQTKTFSSIWTPYEKMFSLFYAACVSDIARYGNATEISPKAGRPDNSFDISSLPWVDFTAFNLNVFAEGTHLAPIFTVGKYVEQGTQTLLPVAMQLHHSACDGYHAGQFIEALKSMAAECEDWI